MRRLESLHGIAQPAQRRRGLLGIPLRARGLLKRFIGKTSDTRRVFAVSFRERPDLRFQFREQSQQFPLRLRGKILRVPEGGLDFSDAVLDHGGVLHTLQPRAFDWLLLWKQSEKIRNQKRLVRRDVVPGAVACRSSGEQRISGEHARPECRRMHLVWNAGADWDGQFSSQVKFNLIVSDSNAPRTWR